MEINHWVNRPAKLEFKKERIQVWIARLDEQQPADFTDLLSDAERIQAARFINPTKSNQFVVARGIMRCLLSAYLDRDPIDLVFQYGINGKPALSDSPDECLCFNLSHSEEIALYGFAQGLQIGVDIEKLNHLNDIELIAKMTLTSTEYLEFQAKSGFDKLNYIYSVWTCKEAVLKMTGQGLSKSLKSISVSNVLSDKNFLLASMPDGRYCEVEIIYTRLKLYWGYRSDKCLKL